MHGSMKIPVSPHPHPDRCTRPLTFTLYTKLRTETKPPVEEWYQSSNFWSLAKSLCDRLPVRGRMRRIQPTLSPRSPQWTYLTLNTIQRCIIASSNTWDGTLHHLDCSLSFTESRISHRFWLEGPLTAYLNEEHFRNKMWHSPNACTSNSLTLLWINILLSCCREQCSPFCLVSPGKGSALKYNNREDFASPQRATEFSLLICYYYLCSILDDGTKLRRSQWALRREVASKPTTR